MAEKRRVTRLELAHECETEMLRSLALSAKYGAEFVALTEIRKQTYSEATARIANRDALDAKDAMGSWKWHVENVRTQALAIQALLALSVGVQIAQRQHDSEVPSQRSTDGAMYGGYPD